MKLHYSVSDYVEFVVSDNVVHIQDSYKVKTIPEMEYIIETLRIKYPSCEVLKRSNTSLINEWRTHNLLYSLGLFKDHTCDVDLNVIPWYANVIYAILSPLYFHY